MIRVTDIIIDPELESLLPPLSEGEYDQLADSISEQGFTDPIFVWLGRGILVDGHNRYRIWKENLGGDEDMAPEIVEKSFNGLEEAKEWMLWRQLARRNLTDAMKVEIALKLKPMLESKAQAKQVQGGLTKVRQNSEKPIRVDQEIAEAAGTSRDTVRKVESVLEVGTDELKQRMRVGDISVNAAYKQANAATDTANKGRPSPGRGRQLKRLTPKDVQKVQANVQRDVSALLEAINQRHPKFLEFKTQVKYALIALKDELQQHVHKLDSIVSTRSDQAEGVPVAVVETEEQHD